AFVTAAPVRLVPAVGSLDDAIAASATGTGSPSFPPSGGVNDALDSPRVAYAPDWGAAAAGSGVESGSIPNSANVAGSLAPCFATVAPGARLIEIAAS